MAHRTLFLFLLTVGLSWTGAYADFRDEVEADWKVQLLQRETGPKRAPTPETDAAGGCDGVKDGKWGFHTENQEGPRRSRTSHARFSVVRAGDRTVWRCGDGSLPDATKRGALSRCAAAAWHSAAEKLGDATALRGRW